jgi:alpha-tubulin suppressor-like RCC1 family protein
VPNFSNIVSVAAGADHTVVLKNDGTVWTWGNNSNGQLGDGTTIQSDAPVQAGGISGITAVAAGNQYTAALKVDNTVWAWGNNSYGQLGNGATTGSLTPVQAQLP